MEFTTKSTIIVIRPLHRGRPRRIELTAGANMRQPGPRLPRDVREFATDEPTAGAVGDHGVHVAVDLGPRRVRTPEPSNRSQRPVRFASRS